MNITLNHQQRGELSKEKAKQRVQEGIYSAKPVLGYLRGRPGEVHIPDPERVPLICLAFHLASVEKKSLRRILQTINELGMRTNTGKQLSLNALHLMLTNPFYAGFVRSDTGPVPGTHEAVISSTEYRTTLRNLRRRRK